MSAVHVWSETLGPKRFGGLSAPRRSETRRVRAEVASPDFGALIGRIAAAADREAFAALFRHFAPRLKSYALRLGASGAAAEAPSLSA